MERILKQESAQKADPGEENSPAGPAGTRSQVSCSTTELSLCIYRFWGVGSDAEKKKEQRAQYTKQHIQVILDKKAECFCFFNTKKVTEQQQKREKSNSKNITKKTATTTMHTKGVEHQTPHKASGLTST